MESIAEKIGHLAGIVFTVIVSLSLIALGLKVLWNWLVPELFNGPEINYWQSLGLFSLSQIMLGTANFNFKK